MTDIVHKVATGHAADHDGQLTHDRQGVQRQERVHLTAQARAVDERQRSDAVGVGQRQTQGDRAAGGVANQIKRCLGADGGQEHGHERCQVGAGSVTVGSGPALTVTGQTIGEVARDAKETPGQQVVHPVSDPIKPTGGLVILKGNLAP